MIGQTTVTVTACAHTSRLGIVYGTGRGFERTTDEQCPQSAGQDRGRPQNSCDILTGTRWGGA